MDDRASETSYRFEMLAAAAAQERGYNFPRPILGRQLNEPIVHWEIVSHPEQGKEVCVLLDMSGEVLNVEWREVRPPPEIPWWKRLLELWR